jgi:hypothetical protein
MSAFELLIADEALKGSSPQYQRRNRWRGLAIATDWQNPCFQTRQL